MKHISDQLLLDYVEGNLDQRRSRELEALAREDRELQGRIAAQRRVQQSLRGTLRQIDRVSLARIAPVMREGRLVEQPGAGGARRLRLAPVLAILLAALFLGGGSWWAGRNWSALTGNRATSTPTPMTSPTVADEAASATPTFVDVATPTVAIDPTSTAEPAPPTPTSRPPMPTPAPIELLPIAPAVTATLRIESLGVEPGLTGLGPRTIVYQTQERDLLLLDLESQRTVSLDQDIEADGCTPSADEWAPLARWSFDHTFLAVRCQHEQVGMRIVVFDMRTGVVYNIGYEDADGEVIWSPTEQRLLLIAHGMYGPAHLRVGLIDMSTLTATPLFEEAAAEESTSWLQGTGEWSPDGAQAAFRTWKAGLEGSGPGNLYIARSDGTSLRRARVSSLAAFGWDAGSHTLWLSRADWSIDESTGQTRSSFVLDALNVEAQGPQVPGSNTSADNVKLEVRWSPDRRWYIQGERLLSRPAMHVRWSLYQADGTLVRVLSIDPDREDFGATWLPDSSGVVILVRYPEKGAELLLAEVEPAPSMDNAAIVLGQYPGVALDVEAPLVVTLDGALIVQGLSDGRIVATTPEGVEVASFEGRLQG